MQDPALPNDDSDRARENASSPECHPAQLGRYALRSATLAAHVARNPSATPRILRCIAQRWPALRGAVARHPSIDRATLLQLADSDPAALFENPALPARISAPPSLPRQSLRRLLKHASAPAWLVPALVAHQHATLRELVAEVVALDAEAATRLSRDADRWVRVQAAAQRALPPAEILRLGDDLDARVRAAVARRGELPPELEQRFAQDPSSWVRTGLAEQAKLVEVRRTLRRDDEWLVRRALAKNPALAEEELAELATDPHVEVRLGVARHAAATAAVLLRLIERPEESSRWDGSVYAAALAHPAMPAAGFERAATSTVMMERRTVAASPRAPRSLLLALAMRDPERWVRETAAQNPGWDPDDAANDVEVREAVEALERDEDEHMRAALVRRSRDAALLARRAGDPSQLVRYRVAGSTSAPPEVLERLWRQEPREMAHVLVQNPATPRVVLREILRYGHQETTLDAIRNPAIPLDDLLDAAASWPLELELVRALWWRLDKLPEGDAVATLTAASDRRALVIDYALCWCERLPEAVRMRIARSGNSLLRVRLASSTREPSCLAVLAADDHLEVRLEVVKRLGWQAYSSGPPLSPEVAAPLVRLLVGDRNPAVRKALAEHARDAGALQRLRLDAELSVRLEALRNPALPQPLLLAAVGRGGPEGEAARSALRRLGHPAGGGPRRLGEMRG